MGALLGGGGGGNNGGNSGHQTKVVKIIHVDGGGHGGGHGGGYGGGHGGGYGGGGHGGPQTINLIVPGKNAITNKISIGTEITSCFNKKKLIK